MAVVNPFAITYAGQQIGGSSSTYLLHGPYIIDKSFEKLRVVFSVVVVASSYSGLKSAADTLEQAFRKRDQNLKIDLGGSAWNWVAGTDIFNVVASLTKSGDEKIDRGYSRGYTCVVEAELPADQDTSKPGLRDINWNVDYEAGRRAIVTCQGVYTATTSKKATANYLASTGADAEAATFLSALKSSATFELVDETYQSDRNDSLCTFTRQYVELLANQKQGTLDAPEIKDHRITFTDLAQHPGDSQEDVYRLRRVIGTYDAAINIESTTDMQAVVKDAVRGHIKQLFQANFSPKVFALEDERLTYDETAKRVSVSFQFLYQREDGEAVIEVSQSLAYRETRTIDYTPLHNQDELAAEVDPGWLVLERIASRTVIVLGKEEPLRRLAAADKAKEAGEIEGIQAKRAIVKAGWNLTQNTSQVTHQWIGDPDEEQIAVSVLTETVVERFNAAVGPGRARTGLTR